MNPSRVKTQVSVAEEKHYNMSIRAETSIHHTREYLEGMNSSDPCLAPSAPNGENYGTRSTPLRSNLCSSSRSKYKQNYNNYSKSCGSLGTNFDRQETVLINISGKKFETYLSTLRRFPDTLLGNPAKLIHFYNHVTGEYFFDRHRKAFNGILYYYQSNGLLERPMGVSESLFTQEALFFGISQDALQYDVTECSEVNEAIPLPSNPYLCKMWILFEQPNSSFSAKVLAVVSVLVIVLSIVVFCVESIPNVNPEKEEGAHMYKTWLVINTICNSWFTLEYVLRLIAAPKKFLFVRSIINIIDLVSILPFYITVALGNRVDNAGNGIAVLKVIRIFRVTRIFKLTRHSRGLHVLASTVKASSHELSMLVLFLAIGVILFSSAAFYAESGSNKKFTSIPAAFWWAVVTMTTVGYGDLYPETTLGKFIGALCAVSGVLVVALPVPVIVSNFEYYYKKEKCRQAREDEVIKKLNQEGKFSPMKQSMKMIAQASITLAGTEKEKGDVTYNPRKRLKDKIQTKISFHLQQEETQTEFEDVEDTQCDSPLLYNSDTNTKTTANKGLQVDGNPRSLEGDSCNNYWPPLNNGHALRDQSMVRSITIG